MGGSARKRTINVQLSCDRHGRQSDRPREHNPGFRPGRQRTFVFRSMGHGRIFIRIDWNTNTNTDPHPHADAHTNSNSDSDANPNAHAYSETHAHTHQRDHQRGSDRSDISPKRKAAIHGNGHGLDQYRRRVVLEPRDRQNQRGRRLHRTRHHHHTTDDSRNGDRESQQNSNGHSRRNSDAARTGSDTDTNSYSNADSDANANTYTNSDPDPNSNTHSVGMFDRCGRLGHDVQWAR